MLNRNVKFVALMAFGLVAGGAFAESYGDYSQQFNSIAPRVESTLKAGAKSFGAKSAGGSTQDSLTEALQRNLEQAQETLKQSEQEVANRKLFDKWNKEENKIQETRQAAASVVPKAIKKRRDEARAQSDSFSQLGQLAAQSQNNGLNNINLSGVEQVCKANVEPQVNQLRQMGQQVQQVVQFFQNAGTNISKEQEEKLKELETKAFVSLAKELEEEAIGEQGGLGAPAQNDITKGGPFVGSPNNELAARLASQEREKPARKQRLSDKKREFVKFLFGEMVPQLRNIRENDGKMQQLCGQMVQAFSPVFQQVQFAAVQAGNNAWQSCKDVKDEVGSNPNAASTIFGKAMQGLDRMFLGAANYTSAMNYYRAGIGGVTGQMRCTDPVNDINNAFGPAQSALSQVGNCSGSDPAVLLQGMTTFLTSLQAAQQQFSQVVQPAIDDCNAAAKTKKKLEKFASNAQQQAAQLQEQQAQAPGRRGQPGQGANPTGFASARGNQPVHTAGTRR